MENTPQDLDLLVTEERMEDMDLETFYGIDTSPRAMIEFIAHFVSNGKGEWLPKQEAVKRVIKGRKLRDIKEINDQLREAIEESAVPNA